MRSPNWRGLSTLALCLLLVSRVPVLGQPPKAKEEEKLTLEVNYDSARSKLPPVVLVEVYRDGKRILYSELDSRTILKRELSAGEYEVHFSAMGWEKTIKRVMLSWEGRTSGDWGLRKVNVELDEKRPVVLGDGPSLQQLQKEITELKRSSAELLESIKRLQAEVNQLKKN